MPEFILALDQGTTSSRAIVFDAHGAARASAQREFAQSYPQSGWVEHDADEIWRTQLDCAREALQRAGLSAADVAAIGITNQRETTLVWERATGRPIAPAIVWQDRRTASQCEALRASGAEALVQERTGLLLDPYFSATKFAWLLDNVPDARARAERGELAGGTIDSWLVWKLTGGAEHLSDVSNAARTALFDIARLAWDDELLALFRVPRALLPRVVDSSGVVASSAPDVLGAPVRIAGIAGDQQAATFGQACFDPGMAKNTYGTGCFMLMNVGATPRRSRHRLLSTVAWNIPGQRAYALEGSVFIAGAVVQWLRDGLGFIRESAEVGELALQVPDSGGVILVPAFAGLGAPHWDAHARGTMLGITRATRAAHIARAALESIAFQSAEVLAAMQGDSAAPLTELRVDGGAARSDLLMQFQADLMGVPVVRPQITETTALGAAYLAGIATGLWSGPAEVAKLWRAERRFEPRMGADERASRMHQWSRAVDRARRWEEAGA